MAHAAPGPSNSPFYDTEFVATYRPPPRPRKKRTTPVPIKTRAIERWICDRCGTKAEFPNEAGRTALEVGWLRLDLTRSLAQGEPPYLFGKNEQILCPECVESLARWFVQNTGVTAITPSAPMSWIPTNAAIPGD